MKVLKETGAMNREEWLEARTVGIGGSDIAAISGLDKWKSPIQVYLDKTGQGVNKPAGEAAYWGNVLEDIVAKEFEIRINEELGREGEERIKVRRRNAIFQHQEHPQLLANVDRLLFDPKNKTWGLLECKTANEFLKDEWVQEEEITPPFKYEMQLQHYLNVLGEKIEFSYIAALVGGNKFFYKEVPRDQELIDDLEAVALDFWREYVEKQTPPPVDDSEATYNFMREQHPGVKDEEFIQLPEEFIDLRNAYKQIKADTKELERQERYIKNQIMDAIKDNAGGYIDGKKVTWKEQKGQKKVDTKRLEKEHPEIYNELVEQPLVRVLRIN